MAFVRREAAIGRSVSRIRQSAIENRVVASVALEAVDKIGPHRLHVQVRGISAHMIKIF